MDFLSDLKGIYKRYNREQNGWSEHLNNTKQKILNSVENKKKQSVVVLGSGWCLDVPFKELAIIFTNVYLVDISHPKSIRKIAKKYNNIKLIEADITNGLIEKTFNFVKQNKKLSELNINELLSIPRINLLDYDYIISVNILNQLDILIVDYIQKYLKISTANITKIRHFIQDYHMKILPANRSLLITDFEEVLLDKNDKQIDIKSLIYTENLNINKGKKWVWKFDSKKTYNASLKTYFNVIAIDL